MFQLNYYLCKNFLNFKLFISYYVYDNMKILLFKKKTLYPTLRSFTS